MKQNVRLDAQAGQHALEQAVLYHAQAVINIPGRVDTTVNGFLLTADASTVLMEITGKPAIKPADLTGKLIHVELFSDQRYQFTTTVQSAPIWGASQALALARPNELTVIDRRRFWRAKLAPSARVALEWAHCGSRERHNAALLNVSVDGLACRVDKLAASAIEVQTSVKARFRMRESTREFELDSLVMNKTPASDGGFILGLQFARVFDSVAQLADLRKILNPGPTVPVSNEAEALT